MTSQHAASGTQHQVSRFRRCRLADMDSIDSLTLTMRAHLWTWESAATRWDGNQITKPAQPSWNLALALGLILEF